MKKSTYYILSLFFVCIFAFDKSSLMMAHEQDFLNEELSLETKRNKPGFVHLLKVSDNLDEEKKEKIEVILKKYENEIRKDPHNIKLILAIADVYYSLGKYKEAAGFYLQVLDLDPQNTKAKISLAKAYLSNKDIAESQVLFTELNEIEPNNSDVLGGLGRIEALKKQDKQAEILYSKSLEINPQNFSTLYYLADLRIDQKRYSEALTILHKLQTIDPQANWVKQAINRAKLGPILDQGKKLEEKKDFDSALTLYTQQLADEPDSLDLYVALAKLYTKMGKHTEAIHTLQQGLKLYPNEPVLLLTLGFTYLEKRELSQAESLLDLVDHQSEGNSEAKAGLGRIAELKGDKQKAEMLYQSSIQLNPLDILPLSYLANLRLEQKRYDEAIQLLEKIYQLDPESTWVQQSIEEAKIAPFLEEINQFEKNQQFTKAVHLYKKLLNLYPHSPFIYLKFGQFYINQKRYQKAIEIYLLGLKEKPHDIPLHVALGFGYLLNHDSANSLKEFKFVLEHDPHNKDALLGIARLATSIGDLQDAYDIYQWVLENNPTDMMALSFLSDLELEQKNYEEAQYLYERILEIDPHAKWARQLLIRAKYGPLFDEIQKLESQSRFDEAQLKYEEILKLAPNSEDVYLELGELYTSQKRYQDAIKLYKKGLEQDPSSIELRVRLGLAYLQIGDLKIAYGILHAVHQADPKNAEALAGLGKIAALNHDVSQAFKMYEEALELNPNDLLALSYYGELLLSQKEFLKAEHVYQKILKLQPHAPWALDALQEAKYGPLFSKIKEKEESLHFKEAEELLLQLLAEAPQEPNFYLKLGQLYMRTKQVDKAILFYLKGLHLAPRSLDLQNAIGFAYLEKGDLDLGRNTFELLLEEHPKNAEALAGMGLFFQKNGNLKLAQKWYEKALAMNSHNITALIFLAKLMVDQHQYDEAEKLYRRIYKLDPSAKWVKQSIEDAKHGFLLAEIQKLEDSKDVKGEELLWNQLLLQAPQVTDYYLRMGFFYQRALQYEKAIHVFLRGLEISPQSSELHAALGLAFISLKKWDKAEQAFQASLKLDSQNPDALAGLGYVAFIHENYQQAENLIRTALSLDPNRIAALSALGELLVKEKKYSEAVKVYEKLQLLRPHEKWIALSLDDARFGPILDQIHDLVTQEKFSEAANLYHHLLEKSPDNPRYYVGLGQMYIRLKEYGNAIAANFTGLQKNPDENELRIALGYAYFFNEDLESARETLEMAVDIDKKNPEALAGLGRVYALEGDYCTAEAFYQKALNIDPKNLSALSFLSDLLMKQKRYTEAEETFSLLRALLPDAEWVQRSWQDARDGPIMDIANRYADQEYFELAAGLYCQLVALSPNDPARYLPLGQMYVNLQRYNTAIRIYQQGLSIDDEAWYLWRAIAFAYIFKEDYCISQSIFSTLVENDPDDAEAWAGLGRIQALVGSPCLAKDYYAAALDISPKNLTALSFLADLYAFEHYYFSARSVYEEMINIVEEKNAVSESCSFPKWLKRGYNDILNLSNLSLSLLGSYHEENQWDPTVHKWSARYSVYGGGGLLNYPINDCFGLWGSFADQFFELKDLLTDTYLYSFDVQRFNIGAKWVYNPCFYMDYKLGFSNFSPYRSSSFKSLHGTIWEPSIVLTYHKPIEKATFSFTTTSDLVARNFNTNVAKLVGYYTLAATYERRIYKRTWVGIEGDFYWFNDFVHNNSQRVLGWFQWRPPCYSENILFRYHTKYQTFAKNIPDYYTYKPQYVNQLQVTLEKFWRVCWADTFYTSLSYGHGWQNTRTRFAQIIVLNPGVTKPPFIWDDRQYNIIFGNMIYKYNQLQIILNGDYYRDTEKYTMWTVGGELRWRF